MERGHGEHHDVNGINPSRSKENQFSICWIVLRSVSSSIFDRMYDFHLTNYVLRGTQRSYAPFGFEFCKDPQSRSYIVPGKAIQSHSRSSEFIAQVTDGAYGYLDLADVANLQIKKGDKAPRAEIERTV